MIRIQYLILVGLLLTLWFGCQSKHRKPEELRNQQLVEKAFENWKNGKGTVFDLLDTNVTWKVAGTSPVSGTYHGKKELLKVVSLINARLSAPIVPTVEKIIAHDSIVVALWQGTAPVKDGTSYDNTYSWHMTFREGKIVRVTALLDTYQLSKLL